MEISYAPSPTTTATPQTAARLQQFLPAIALTLTVATAVLMANWLAQASPTQQKLSGFTTSLDGRSRNQRRNAFLAARSIDGRIIPPNGVFSFNQTVKSWSVDQGYVKALVSYDGELVRAYGGGVCQTSTTLYNAALLAGLPILERHSHVFVPHYITPGRDAAVAFPGIDLRFRNPNPWPIRIGAKVVGQRLEVTLTGAEKPSHHISVKTEMLAVTLPQRLTRITERETGSSTLCAYLHSAGATGYRVLTYRTINSKRESLSDDTYPSMNRVIALNRD
jgi:vancomycin resistance protein VanW